MTGAIFFYAQNPLEPCPSANSVEVMVLHFACALLRAPLLNLNTHLVPRELSHILRDSSAKAVFARRHPHGDVLRSVAGNDADPGAVSLPAMLSVVWVPDLRPASVSPGAATPRGGTDEDVARRANVSGLKNFEWARDTLHRHAFGGSGGSSFPLFSENMCSAFPSVGGGSGGRGSDNAHMYYTSGTTGNPKGVMLTHDVVAKHAVATCAEMRIDASDVWAHVAPMFHLVDAFAVYSVTLAARRNEGSGIASHGKSLCSHE